MGWDLLEGVCPRVLDYGTDGATADGVPGCVGGIDNTVTAEDGEIALYGWGIGSPNILLTRL
jgi:hypothetical protein